jgi:hypothetical protein
MFVGIFGLLSVTIIVTQKKEESIIHTTYARTMPLISIHI